MPRYGQRAPRPTKLDAFKPYVPSRIEATRAKSISAAMLLRAIRERGCEGGRLKVFLQPLKAVAAPDSVVRFETAPRRRARHFSAGFRI